MRGLQLFVLIASTLYIVGCGTDNPKEDQNLLIGHWVFVKGKADGMVQVAGDPNNLWNDLTITFTDKEVDFIILEQLGFAPKATYALDGNTLELKEPKLQLTIQELTEGRLHFDFLVNIEGQEHSLEMEFEKAKKNEEAVQ